MVSRKTIEKMKEAIGENKSKIAKEALFPDEGEMYSTSVQIAYRQSDNKLFVDRVQSGSSTDTINEMSGVTLSFFINGAALNDIIEVDPDNEEDEKERWEDALISPIYADMIDEQIKEGIDGLYEEYGVAKTMNGSTRCPDGYHWVDEHTRDRYIHVKAHCARDPRRR